MAAHDTNVSFVSCNAMLVENESVNVEAGEACLFNILCPRVLGSRERQRRRR